MQEEIEKGKWIQRYLDEWAIKCPECQSTDVDELDIYKGHYKKGNPLGKRNQRKYRCNQCKEEYWVEI